MNFADVLIKIFAYTVFGVFLFYKWPLCLFCLCIWFCVWRI